jgi:hypothetical protein
MSVRLWRTLVLAITTVLIPVCAVLAGPGVPAERPAGSDRSTNPPSSASAASTATSLPASAPGLGELAAITPTGRATGSTVGGTPGTTAESSAKTTAAGTPTARPSRTSLLGWRLIFHEDFTTNAASGGFLGTYRNFGAYPWGWLDTSKRGHYDPNILSVSRGMLTMHLYTSSDGVHHVAAPYPKLPGGGSNQLYGRYSVRFRADAVDGYKVAWLLWPQSEIWSDGEIDFPEGDLTRTMSAFMHYVGAPTEQDYFGTGVGFANWHVATTEWSPNKVVFSFDGRVIGTSTRHVPAKPMHYVLQTETELGADPVPSNTAGNVQVDWVAIWRYEP